MKLNSPSVARTVNLLAPGVGLMLIGRLWTGALIGLLFTAAANAAVWATLLIADDFRLWEQGLAIGAFGGVYFAAQLRLGACLREQETQALRSERDRALAAALGHLHAGETLEALEALEPIADRADFDLLVAYRIAQILTAAGDVEGGLEAWDRVERLDKHHLYRVWRLEGTARLRSSQN